MHFPSSENHTSGATCSATEKPGPNGKIKLHRRRPRALQSFSPARRRRSRFRRHDDGDIPVHAEMLLPTSSLRLADEQLGHARRCAFDYGDRQNAAACFDLFTGFSKFLMIYCGYTVRNMRTHDGRVTSYRAGAEHPAANALPSRTSAPSSTAGKSRSRPGGGRNAQCRGTCPVAPLILITCVIDPQNVKYSGGNL